MQHRITPFLWFDNEAEEAMKHYVSIFKNSKAGAVVRYNEAIPEMRGKVLTASFTLDGQEFVALNGGPQFKFTEAVSFVINCETQEEIDYYWGKLIGGGGSESMCGWLKDKFGLSWQVVPTTLPALLNDKDGDKARRATQAMLKMRKIVIKDLENA